MPSFTTSMLATACLLHQWGILTTSLIGRASLTALALGDAIEPVVDYAPLQLIMSVSTSTHLVIFMS